MVAIRSNLMVVLLICCSGGLLLAASEEKPTSMPIGDLPGWKQTFAQDFESPAAPGEIGEVYGRDMRGYSGFRDTSGSGIYTPDSVLSVSGGKLDFFLHSEGGKPRVASAVPFGYQGQIYGRYSIRFRSDALPGYKIAFMLWPSSGNWNEGEIDWPEGNLNYEMYPGSAVKGSLKNGVMKFDPPTHIYSPTDAADWHVATTEWTPGKVKWFWDGVVVGETTLPAGVPTTKFRWTLQAETQIGDDAPIPAPQTAGHLQVDWAVQYAYAP
jgi:beta-glucanase (GH16 family)